MMTNALIRLLVPFKRQLLMIAGLSLITNLMMLVPTIYMLQLYDRVMLSRNTLTLIAVTLMVSFLLMMMALSEWLRSAVAIKSGVRFDQLYGGKIFSMAFSRSLNASKTSANQALSDLTMVRQFVTGNGLFAFFDTPWSLIYIFVLFVLNPILGITAIVFCTIQFGLALWNQHTCMLPLQFVTTSQNNSELFLQNKIRNLETIHVMGMLKPLYQRWLLLSNALFDAEREALNVQSRSQFVNKVVRYTMQSLMLAVAAILTVQGKISVGSMIASNVLIARALQPFDVIVSTWRQYVQARIGAESILHMLDDTAIPRRNKDQSIVEGYYQLNNVGITLSGLPVLQNITLDIKPGRILNMMGASGSGKTTLARTLVGLVNVTQGELLIDGIASQHIPPSRLSAEIGYLPQQVALLEGSIAENVARFGDLDTTGIIAACQAVGLHESILRLPQGYDTLLDEHGTQLSGGQRQLLGLARAIYKQPQIIVLDEPNANLDEFGEAYLLNVLQQLKQLNKTIVIISHRSGLLKITDDLLILKNGEMVHFGPRDAGIVYLNQLQNPTVASA